MDPEFWHERWRRNEIGFHESQPNRLLVQYLSRLPLRPGHRVLLPLCGKTLDIGWILSRGFEVCGIELSTDAVEQLFDQLGVDPDISDCEGLRRYSAERIDIFAGDFFALSSSVLGTVNGVYDRAALVALPAETRRRYAAHLARITNGAPQLLICFEYDQDSMPGPPFSVGQNDVVTLYGGDYEIERLASVDVPGGLKGMCAAKEVAWLLRRASGSR